jgi:hypothetical protein
MLVSRIDSPPTVIVSPSCTDVTVPVMRCLPTLTPQWVLPDTGAKLAPSPPPHADKTTAIMNNKGLIMAAA